MVTKNIVFLLTNKRHSGVLKRVESFIDNDYNVSIYGFDRGFGKEVTSLKEIPIIDLGLVDNGKSYLYKLFNAYRIFRKIFKKHTSCKYYVFSFDFALICLLCRRKYIYEIRDLVYGYFSSKLVMNTFKLIDKMLIRFSVKTIMLSEGFVDFIYGKKKVKKVIVQPNKIHYSFSKETRPKVKLNKGNEFVFGFIGALRFPNTIMRFARIIGENFPQHKFMFFGDGIPEYRKMVEDLTQRHQNISFHGSFKNPDDLGSIYDQVDLSLSCYDSEFVNVQYAEPNKLYESIFFQTPIIVSSNTFLGNKVKRLNVGFIIEATSDKSIAEYIESLSIEEVNKVKRKMSNFNPSDLIDDRAKNIISQIDKSYE